MGEDALTDSWTADTTNPKYIDLTANSLQPAVLATAPPSQTSNVTGAAEVSPAAQASCSSSADMPASMSMSGSSPSMNTVGDPCTSSPSAVAAQSLSGDQLSPTIMYQVSINMACTRVQLDDMMIGLAGIGTGVTIQIDRKA